MIVCPAVGIQYSGFWDVGWSSYDGEEPCDDLDAYYRYHQHQVRKGSQHPTGGAPDHRRRKRRRAIHSIVLSPRVATYVHCPQVVSTSMSSTSPRQVEAAPSMFTPLSSFASRIRHPHVGSVGADGITMTHANALVV